MNNSKSLAEWTVGCSENYNVDNLFSFLFREQSLEELRKHLLDVYFHSVNAILADGAGAGTFAGSLVTLQNLIEILNEMEGTSKPGQIVLKLKEN